MVLISLSFKSWGVGSVFFCLEDMLVSMHRMCMSTKAARCALLAISQAAAGEDHTELFSVTA